MHKYTPFDEFSFAVLIDETVCPVCCQRTSKGRRGIGLAIDSALDGKVTICDDCIETLHGFVVADRAERQSPSSKSSK